jgi:NTP pyrophosphatase (non-canonical NTP hydrolase)
MTLLSQAFNFRTAYGLTEENSPASLQLNLIAEEYGEFEEAAEDPDISDADTLKELGDLVFVCYQYAAVKGWDLDEAMNRILASNMSKLDDNGKPIRNEDGKIMKGPNYFKPDLSDLA